MNPEPTQAVQLAESDIELLMLAIEFTLERCGDVLTDETKKDLDALFQHLDRQGSTEDIS